jgi:hypothetical protein
MTIMIKGWYAVIVMIIIYDYRDYYDWLLRI